MDRALREPAFPRAVAAVRQDRARARPEKGEPRARRVGHPERRAGEVDRAARDRRRARAVGGLRGFGRESERRRVRLVANDGESEVVYGDGREWLRASDLERWVATARRGREWERRKGSERRAMRRWGFRARRASVNGGRSWAESEERGERDNGCEERHLG